MLIDSTGQVAGVFTEHRLQLTNAADLLALNRHYLNEGGDTPRCAPHGGQAHASDHAAAHRRRDDDRDRLRDRPARHIEEDCRIGNHVLIADAVILRGSVIEDGRQVVGEVVS